MWRRAGFIIGMYSLIASACGDPGGGGGPGSDLDFPETLDFGRVPVRLRVTESIPFVQQGVGAVDLVEVRPGSGFTGPDYEFSVATALPIEIGRGGPRNLDVEFFAGDEIEPVEASMTVVFSNGFEQRIDLAASVDRAIDLDLMGESPLLDFGEVIVGRVVEDQSITLTNRLDRPIPIYFLQEDGRPAVDRLSGSGTFEIDVALDAEGRATTSPINPSRQLEIPIQYTPPSEGGDRDRAILRLGACPTLDNICGIDVTLTARPITAPIECRLEGEDDVVETIDFDTLNPPETATATVACEVTSETNLDSFASPSFIGTGIQTRLPSGIVPPDDVEVGTEFQVVFEFDPAALDEGEDIPEETTFEINVKDQDSGNEQPKTVIVFEGGHGRPILSSSPDVVDFQSVRLTTSKPDRLFVTNSGPVAFEGRMRIENDPGTEAGAFTSPTDGTRFPIAPGETKTIDVTFNGQPEVGEKRATVIIETTEFTDPRNPNIQITLPLVAEAVSLPNCNADISPRLDAVAPQIRFGRSEARTENRAFVVVTNEGVTECLLNGIRFSPDTDPEFELVDSPAEVRLEGGESHAIEIGFTPDRPADAPSLSHSGTLEFYVSSQNSFVQLDMAGEQSTLPLVRAPNVVDLVGGANACTKYEAEVALLNGNAGSITVTDVDPVFEDAVTFSVELGDNEVPFTIPGDFGRRTFRVIGRPPASAVDHRRGRIEVEIDGGGTPFVIPVILRVAPDLPVTESFVQGGAPESEVLFVLPYHADSGDESVADVQQRASQFWDDFSAPLESAGLDYEIGFIRGQNDVNTCGNDVGSGPQDPGMLHLGGCGWLANGDIPPGSGLNSRLWKLIDGDEGPIDAPTAFEGHMTKTADAPFTFDPAMDVAARAFHPAPIGDWNSELLSTDAHTHVVFLNNVDADSARAVEAYADWLRYARGFPRRFDQTASAIAGLESTDCNTSNVGTVRATPSLRRLNRLVGGGLPQSVCDADWPAKMEAVGRAATGIRRRVRLERSAIPASIQVFADGVELPAGSGDAANWTYDATDRLLTFTSSTSSAVAPGTEVDIVYDPECDN